MNIDRAIRIRIRTVGIAVREKQVVGRRA